MSEHTRIKAGPIMCSALVPIIWLGLPAMGLAQAASPPATPLTPPAATTTAPAALDLPPLPMLSRHQVPLTAKEAHGLTLAHV
jgi:hypothetical protein